ncbi:MAG: aldo/keto reductase [Elusimicrobiota bacterium]
MKKRAFGRVGAGVSEISFGAASVSGEGGGYGFGHIGEKEAIALLRAAFDRGVNLFDTAPVYGFGVSEKRIGEAFAGAREKVFLVSKCGVAWDDAGRMRLDNSPDTVRRMLEGSLRDLRTEYIDLYFIHWPDKGVDVRGTMEVLAEAKRAGKIRAIGLSNFYDEGEIRRAMEVERIDALQTEFNLFNTRAAAELFPFVREEGLGHMSYGPFDKGILSGTVGRARKFDEVDFRSTLEGWASEGKMRAMDRINELLKARGFAARELALGFVLGHPEASTAICGVKSEAQLESAVKALEHLPPPDLIAEARRIADEELAGAVSS